jgi:epoxyqueuosine reductase
MIAGLSTERIIQATEERGWACRLVPAERRSDLWRELEERLAGGELDEVFFEERLRYFEQPIKEAPGWAESILIVAIPDPAFRIRFDWQGREVSLTVPPTFIHWQTLGDPCVQALLAKLAGDGTTRTEIAVLPRKLLAARTGLARYGRNNITYVEGMGSYHRLCCLYTDIPCDRGPWQAAEILGSCESCGACIRACPANAIDPDRFMVHAERCITYWQEKPGDVSYPEELDFSWQDQFIGCMRCQDVCPHNQGLLKVEEAGPPFTEEETAAFLRGVTAEELPEKTIEKLKQHDVLDYLEVLPRNLLASLENAVGDAAGSESRAD